MEYIAKYGDRESLKTQLQPVAYPLTVMNVPPNFLNLMSYCKLGPFAAVL